jgi:tetratricopeptide (TPR) repeat protein
MAKKKDTTEERIVAVEEALSKSEQFIERNQKILTYVVGGIIVVILLFFGYKKYVSGPKEKTAQSLMFTAEYYFEKDSMELALFGDGESYGFIDIVDDYGSTAAGNLAKYYAGVCYLNMGEYEEAISYLKKFSSNDVIVPGMALGAIGDAYVQLNDLEKAADYYLSAANANDNDFVSPAFLMKAGWTYEILGEWEQARDIYQRLKKEYPKARESRDIDKYLARAKANLGEL